MYVRPATVEDREVLLHLGERAYREARYVRYPYSREKSERLFDAIHAEGSEIFCNVLCHGELVVGMVVGLVTEHFFASMRYAANLVLYVTPPCRGGMGAARLIRSFEESARARNAAEILIGSTSNSNPTRVIGLYKKLGYAPVGANAVKYLGE